MINSRRSLKVGLVSLDAALSAAADGSYHQAVAFMRQVPLIVQVQIIKDIRILRESTDQVEEINDILAALDSAGGEYTQAFLLLVSELSNEAILSILHFTRTVTFRGLAIQLRAVFHGCN